jgi:hypothetical protein
MQLFTGHGIFNKFRVRINKKLTINVGIAMRARMMPNMSY